MKDLERQIELALKAGRTTAHKMFDLVGNMTVLTTAFAERYSSVEILFHAQSYFLTYAGPIFELDTVKDSPTGKPRTVFRTDEQGRLIPQQGVRETGGITFADFQAIYYTLQKRKEITWQELNDLISPYRKRVVALEQSDFFHTYHG